jgi:DNA-binding transcriptional LysR family regulator
MLDVVRLATFRAVLDTGSLSAAARALHLSQPAVSRQIALLERELRTSLLVRSRGGVRVTPAGQLLLSHATAVLDRLALAEAQLKALIDQPGEPVRLGSFFSALVHLSTEVGGAIGQQHPDLRIVDDLVDRDTAFARLRRGDLDLAVVFEHDFAAQPVPDDLVVEPLFDDPLRLLLPAQHPLATTTAVDLTRLATDTWIQALEGSAAELVDRVLARHGLVPPRLLVGHGDEPVEVQALVAAGRGVTLTHSMTVLTSQHDLALLPIVDETGVRHVSVVHPPGLLTPAATVVRDALRGVGERRGGPARGGAR